jgi:type II secretory pathway component PulF
MVLFKYQARDKQGKFITGSRQASDRDSVIGYLRENELFPIGIEEIRSQAKRLGVVSSRLKDKEITFFTRQLCNLLDSGIPLPRSLSILVNQTKNQKLRHVIAKIKDEVSRGGYFWESLSKYPEVFSRLYVSMVKAGETGAGLEKVMKNLADFVEQKREIKNTLTSMLIYPSILLLVGIGTIFFLMTFVMPRMIFMFSDISHSLPLITKFLIAISMFLSRYWWLLLFLFAVGIFVIKRLYSQGQGRLRFEQFLHKLPLIGETLQKVIFARFTRILGLALSNGISILDSLDVAQEVVQNQLIAKSLADVQVQVSQGSALSASLTQAKIFPPIMVDMASVGEETGHLEEALLKIAQIYDRESQEEIKRLLSLLEPILIFLLAVGVGFLVMAMLLPILQMNLQIL